MNQADVRHAQRRGSLGLHSMRQRAASIGADLQVQTDTTGTRILVEWPR
jgi:signal transduction histidine kinase